MAGLLATFPALALSLAVAIAGALAATAAGLGPSEQAILAFLVLASLAPSVEISAGLPALRLEQVGVFVVFLLMMHRLRPSRWDLPFWGMTCSILLSTASAGFLGQPIITRDLFEPAKVAIYWMLFSLGAGVELTPRFSSWFRGLIVVLSVALGLLSVAQVLNLFSINSWLSPVYTPSWHMDQLVGSLTSRRATGPPGDPNSFALSLNSLIFLLLGRLVVEPRRSVSGLFALIVAIAGMLLTQSRTALLAFGAGLLALVPLLPRRIRWTTTGALLLGVSVLLLFMERGLFTYLRDLGSGLTSHSLQLRYAIWRDALTLFAQRPLLGWGPAKGVMSTVVDSEYVLHLRRYGSVGLATLIMFWASVGKGALSAAKSTKNGFHKELGIALATTTAVIAVTSMTNNVFNNTQYMSFLALIAGLTFNPIWRCLGDDCTEKEG